MSFVKQYFPQFNSTIRNRWGLIIPLILFIIEEEVMRVIINICAIILSLFAIVVHAGAVIDYNNVEEVARGSPDT